MADDLSSRLRRGAIILRSLAARSDREEDAEFVYGLEQFALDCEEAATRLMPKSGGKTPASGSDN